MQNLRKPNIPIQINANELGGGLSDHTYKKKKSKTLNTLNVRKARTSLSGLFEKITIDKMDPPSLLNPH